MTRFEPAASFGGAVMWNALLFVAAPEIQPRAVAAASGRSKTIAAAPSLKIVPERSGSKGRITSVVIVRRLERPHHAYSVSESYARTSILSARPSRMTSAARLAAAAPDAQDMDI